MILQGRSVTDITIEGVDRADFPDFVDAFVGSARFKDTGRNLTDEELDILTEENAGEVQELAQESVY